MPPQTSRFEVCRSDFSAGVDEVRRILALDPARSAQGWASTEPAADAGAGSNSEGKAEADTSATSNSEGVAVRRAAVVLLVSHFEGFLKTLAENLTDVFNTGHFAAGSLPLQLREMHLVPKFAEIVTAKNSTQKFALMKKLDGVSALWKNQAKPSAGTLDPSAVSGIITNAQSGCIDALFETFGEGQGVCNGDLDVWNPDTERDEPSNIVNGLRDAVGCRNEIAHGGADRRPTSGDVDRYMLFLTAFATRLTLKAEQIESGATSDSRRNS